MKRTIILIFCCLWGSCYYSLISSSQGIVIHQSTIRYDSLNNAICDVEIVWDIERIKYWAREPLPDSLIKLWKDQRQEIGKGIVKWSGHKEWSGRLDINKFGLYFTDTAIITIDSIWKEPKPGYYATLWLGIKNDGRTRLCAVYGDTLYCEDLEINNGKIIQKSYGKSVQRNKTNMQIYRRPHF